MNGEKDLSSAIRSLACASVTQQYLFPQRRGNVSPFLSDALVSGFILCAPFSPCSLYLHILFIDTVIGFLLNVIVFNAGIIFHNTGMGFFFIILLPRGRLWLIQLDCFSITEGFLQNLRRYRSFTFQSVTPRQTGRKMAMNHYLIARLSFFFRKSGILPGRLWQYGQEGMPCLSDRSPFWLS